MVGGAEKNNSQGNLAFGAFVLSIIGLLTLASLSLVYGKQLSHKVYPGVHVGGIDASHMTAEQLYQTLQYNYQQYSNSNITLGVMGAEIHPKPAELGAWVDYEQTIAQAMAVGRENKIVQHIGVPALGRKIELPLVVHVDDGIFVSYLEELDDWLSTPVKNPQLTMEKGEVVVVPGQIGDHLIPVDFSDDFALAVSIFKPFTINIANGAVPPRVTVEALEVLLPEAQLLTKKTLALSHEENLYEMNGDTLGSMLAYTINPNNSVSLTLNEAGLVDFLMPINEELKREAKKTFDFNAGTKGKYAIKNSQGREVDLPGTVGRILGAMHEPSSETIEIALTIVDPEIEMLTVDAPKPEGKVISVDLSKQALFAHEDGELLFWTRVSTGLNNWTPTGEWRINNKTPIQKMSGPGYYLPNVKWVMPYDGDYTLHTAYWHNDFGVPKSHGCTNMAEEDAKWLYDWANVGTPVVIYEG